MNIDFIKLIPSALTITYVTYGTCYLIKDIFCSIFPFSILLTVALVALIHFFRVPPPDPQIVDVILGKEPHENVDGNDYVLKTVAHRGAGLDAPENTLTAFKMCAEKGCDFIEFDIKLTQDGVPVVFHDSTLERIADIDMEICKTQWEDLKVINLSVKHPLRDRYGVTNIPTLEQAVDQMLVCGQRMFIDIKDNDTKVVGVIHDLFVRKEELYSRAVVSSFFPNIIYLIRRGNPKIVCSLAWRPHFFAYESYKYPEGKGSKRATAWHKHILNELNDIVYAWCLPRITYYFLGLSALLLHKDALSGLVLLMY
ncbi:unnamed protein product [Acanthoscelides obtectus]|uniref:GP-PDE domain-containing protein n=1 Tax=Acanthoscelides obtectus TaxID=200917 RepID=A0A9P0P5N2_ACAOB|nr:unnamed protein product [Acanthoscelides obtectus]CAK1633499.1 Glycerophosphodiester phosphodiesterase 1 [Acanthoscelides obtectus]